MCPLLPDVNAIATSTVESQMAIGYYRLQLIFYKNYMQDWKHIFYTIFGNYFKLSDKTLDSDDGQVGTAKDNGSG